MAVRVMLSEGDYPVYFVDRNDPFKICILKDSKVAYEVDGRAVIVVEDADGKKKGVALSGFSDADLVTYLLEQGLLE
jgi:hypothetical protein